MASKIGKALGFSMDLGKPKGPSIDEDMDETLTGEGIDDALPDEPEMSGPESSGEPKGGSAEVLAMKQFERATSPEAKVQALKDFGEACGWTSGPSY